MLQGVTLSEHPDLFAQKTSLNIPNKSGFFPSTRLVADTLRPLLDKPFEFDRSEDVVEESLQKL